MADISISRYALTSKEMEEEVSKTSHLASESSSESGMCTSLLTPHRIHKTIPGARGNRIKIILIPMLKEIKV